MCADAAQGQKMARAAMLAYPDIPLPKAGRLR